MPNSISTEYGDYPFVDISVLMDDSKCVACENEGELRHLLHAMKSQYPEFCENWNSRLIGLVIKYPQYIRIYSPYRSMYRSDDPPDRQCIKFADLAVDDGNEFDFDIDDDFLELLQSSDSI